MPLFEFKCSECNKSFEELVRSANKIEEVTCPTCGSQKVNKKISIFASKTTGGGSLSSFASTSSSCSTGST